MSVSYFLSSWYMALQLFSDSCHFTAISQQEIQSADSYHEIRCSPDECVYVKKTGEDSKKFYY